MFSSFITFNYNSITYKIINTYVVILKHFRCYIFQFKLFGIFKTHCHMFGCVVTRLCQGWLLCRRWQCCWPGAGGTPTRTALVAGVLVVVVTILVTSTTTSQHSCSWPPVHPSTWSRSSSPRAEVGRHLLHLGGQLRVTAITVQE